MTEQIPDNNQEIKEKIAHYKRMPVLLASSSVFRQAELESAGWQDVTRFSGEIPELVEIETSEAVRVGDLPLRSAFDIHDGAGYVRHVAAAKVRYVLDVTPEYEGLVIGMDTAPTYHILDNGDGESKPQHIEKPETVTKAHELILELLQKTAAGMVDHENKLESYLNGPGRFAEGNPKDDFGYKNLQWSYDPGHIDVNTGIAVSFPQDRQHIHFHAEQARLFLHALDSIKEDARSITQLAAQVADHMGERTVQVTGGIDFADPSIRELLGVEEQLPAVDSDQQADSHYLGSSTRGLEHIIAVHG